MSLPTSWECTAFDGERVPDGENFVPGPDYCTACKCERGEPRFCRAALCQPRQDCKSFRVGESCCDFICLDDILPTINKDHDNVPPSPDTGLRMVASAITAILSLALLLFLIHRLRQRKLRIAQHQYFEDQLDALGGIPNDSCRNNPCCHNAVYLTGNDHVDFFLDGHMPAFTPWKPPSYYFQPSDAPPPYSEVVANDRAMPDGTLPSLNPLMVQLNPSREQDNSLPRNISALRSIRTATIDAFQFERGENIAICLQSNPIASSTLLSDETYGNSPIRGRAGRRRPHSLYNPPTVPLNDLNRGTSSSSTATVTRNNEDDQDLNDSTCHCEGTYNREKCNVCSIKQQISQERNSNTRDAGGLQSNSIVEDFCRNLRLDISPSSTSTEGISHLSSVESSSRTSSGESPSVEGSNEATC